MFEVIPVVGHKDTFTGKIDQHYFRNWLNDINSGKASDINKDYIGKRARLEQLSDSIRSGVKQINGKFVFIGELLRTIADERLYMFRYAEEVDCRDIYKYARVHFGLKKTNTFNLIGIAKEFAHLGELDKRWKEYTYSQLCEMLSMSDEERQKVTPDMTIKQIREFKNVLAKGNEIQTFEYEVVDEVSDENTIQLNTDTVVKLIKLLEEGYEKFLNCDIKNVYHAEKTAFAKWLIEKGVNLS